MYTCNKRQSCQRTCDSRGKSKSAVGQRQDMSADTVPAQTHTVQRHRHRHNAHAKNTDTVHTRRHRHSARTDTDTVCAQTQTHSATCGSPPPSFHPLTSWSPASPLNGLLCSKYQNNKRSSQLQVQEQNNKEVVVGENNQQRVASDHQPFPSGHQLFNALPLRRIFCTRVGGRKAITSIITSRLNNHRQRLSYLSTASWSP